MRQICLIVPLVLVALGGCSKKPDNALAVAQSTPAENPSAVPGVALADVTVQLPAVPGRPAAAYFVLTAGQNASGKIVAVQVDHFARAEMHQSKMQGPAMTMSSVESLAITPGKPIVFAPGGYHVMLTGGDGMLKPGSRTSITLTLDSGDQISAGARVVAPGNDDMRM